MGISTPKQLYIVRHGQTEYNKQKIVQGRGVNSDLNDTGRAQAQQFYEAFKHEKFDTIYASSLKRSQQSIAHFVRGGHSLNIRENLDEISWGKYEGQQLNEEMKKAFEQTRHEWYRGNTAIPTPQGESADELHQRVKDFLKEVTESEAQKILICSHGRTIRVMLCELTGIPIADMRTFDPDNLGLYQLEWEPPQLAVVLKNNSVAHIGKNK